MAPETDAPKIVSPRPVLNDSMPPGANDVAMNAWLFTALATRSQVRPIAGRYGPQNNFIQTWDSCVSSIVGSDSPDEAEKRFEAWLRRQPEGENPVEIRIRKIAAAQFVDCLFTESGSAPLDWPEILKQSESALQSTPVDDFEQGYWADVDEAVPPGKLSYNLELLQRDVAEDFRSGLNWSGDRQFLFLLSALSPLAPTPDPLDAPEPDESGSAASSDEAPEPSDEVGLGELFATYPQALDKEAVALIQARNSVVAAWLWRRYAAGTRLAANPIRIDPWCGAIGLDGK